MILSRSTDGSLRTHLHKLGTCRAVSVANSAAQVSTRLRRPDAGCIGVARLADFRFTRPPVSPDAHRQNLCSGLTRKSALRPLMPLPPLSLPDAPALQFAPGNQRSMLVRLNTPSTGGLRGRHRRCTPRPDRAPHLSARGGFLVSASGSSRRS